MKDDINDFIKKYSDDNPEKNKIAREKLNKSNLEAEMLALEVLEKQQYLDLRKKWSKQILLAFWIILGSGLTFIILVGTNVFDYSKYNGVPQSVLGTFFLQIVGLAFVVAKFLFPNQGKK